MTRHFQHEIEKLKKKILRLSASVEDNLRLAAKSVSERDLKLAQRVVEVDTEIDLLEVEVEEDCLKILALHQPVAIDLRFVVAALKINNDLERIGDLAVNMAKRGKILAGLPSQKIPFNFDGMLTLTIDMVKRSTDSLIDMDPQIARDICATDDTIDNHLKDAYRQLQAEMQAHPDMIKYGVALLGVARNLERIADHATNIAEDVIYMVEGEIVRHRGNFF
jgi:phosphate transport system protein